MVDDIFKWIRSISALNDEQLKQEIDLFHQSSIKSFARALTKVRRPEVDIHTLRNGTLTEHDLLTFRKAMERVLLLFQKMITAKKQLTFKSVAVKAKLFTDEKKLDVKNESYLGKNWMGPVNASIYRVIQKNHL